MAESPSISRRRVAAGVAWTVPAVALHAAAPAFAASCPVASGTTTSTKPSINQTTFPTANSTCNGYKVYEGFETLYVEATYTISGGVAYAGTTFGIRFAPADYLTGIKIVSITSSTGSVPAYSVSTVTYPPFNYADSNGCMNGMNDDGIAADWTLTAPWGPGTFTVIYSVTLWFRSQGHRYADTAYSNYFQSQNISRLAVVDCTRAQQPMVIGQSGFYVLSTNGSKCAVACGTA